MSEPIIVAMAPPKPPHVAICVPIGGRITPHFFRSYRMLDRSGIRWSYHDMIGYPVATARNEITRSILAEPTFDDVTHFLWIDDDMVFAPETLKRLLAHDRPIVGGLCFSRQPPHKPVIARFYDPSWGFDANSYGFLWDYPADRLIDVDATGGAFLLVKREVFEAIRTTFGDASWWTPKDELSEDFAFCRRAVECGYSIQVDTGCKIGHVGEIVIDEDFSRRNRQFEPQRWHPPLEGLLDAVRMEPKSMASPGLVALDEGRTDVPLASIVIPTFNERPEFLRGAVLSAVAQTVPVEVIIVDDGSTSQAARDVLSEIAFRFPASRVRAVLHGGNRGIAAALNTGIAAMSTPWFCWLSSDDLFEPTKVESQLGSMISAWALASYTGYHLKFNNSNAVGHVRMVLWNSMAEQQATLAERCSINGSTVMIAKSVLDDVGPFDETLRYAQDWDMWSKIGRKYWWFGMLDKLTTRREFDNLSADTSLSSARRIEDAIVQRRYALRSTLPGSLFGGT